MLRGKFFTSFIRDAEGSNMALGFLPVIGLEAIGVIHFSSRPKNAVMSINNVSPLLAFTSKVFMIGSLKFRLKDGAIGSPSLNTSSQSTECMYTFVESVEKRTMNGSSIIWPATKSVGALVSERRLAIK